MRYILLCAFLLAFSGCIQGIAVSTVGGIVDDGFSAITGESDLDFAEKALPANIKLLEVMLKSDPENVRMLVLTSQGYSSYALAYLEDSLQDRARDFYARGRDYGLRILRQDDDVAKALDGTVDDLKAVLERKGKDLVPGAFWAAFGWGSFIQLSLDNPDAIGDLPRAEALMEFVTQHDSAYYYGGAHVFLGTLYGSRPKMLGGNIDLARKHFESALRINGGKFLMTYVYQAKSVAVQTLDEELFDSCLRKVQEASLEILPEFRLANAIAKRKAQLLLSRRADLF
jgi:tetratricopeptide (TPR) repeat protein